MDEPLGLLRLLVLLRDPLEEAGAVAEPGALLANALVRLSGEGALDDLLQLAAHGDLVLQVRLLAVGTHDAAHGEALLQAQEAVGCSEHEISQLYCD